MAMRHQLRRKDVHAGKHGRVGAGGGDVGAESVFEEDALLGEAVQVRAGQPVIAVATHMVGPQRVDTEQDDVWFGGRSHRAFHVSSSLFNHGAGQIQNRATV